MKNFTHIKQIRVLMLLAVIFLFQSCSDFLEQEPGTQISITEQLSTKKGVLQALNGLYSDVEAIVRDPRFAVYADLQGGNLKFTPLPSTSSSAGLFSVPVAIQKVYSFNDDALESNFSSFYSGNYTNINQANLLLEFVDALPDATDAEKNQIKAEALAIRAYSHFLLSEIYSQPHGFTADASHLGIVCNSKAITNGIQYPTRSTVAETYSFIINDLTEALKLYSSASLLTGPAYSFFSANSTKALLARVYLSKNDWKNAYDTSNDIITNSGVSLMTTSNYITQWEQPDLPVSEILLEFSIPRDGSGVAGGSLSTFFGYEASATVTKYVATQDLLSLYETADIRKNMFLVQPLNTLVNGVQTRLNYSFTKKYQGNPGYVAFRLSEQYLIRAEAALGLNNPDQAKTDINTIRARANATLLTNNSNLADAIFLERRKELCFEGLLFFDMSRNKKNISRVDGCISQSCGLTYPSPKFVLPIPRSSINVNPNIKQNESY